MRPYLLTLLLLCLGLCSQAQTDSLRTPVAKKRPFLYQEYHHYGHTESSLGLAPEVSFFGDYAVGLGISKGWYGFGCMGGGGHGFTLGYSYAPNLKISIIHAAVWGCGGASIFGFYGGIRGFYFTDGRKGRPGIRPEIGYSLLRLHIHYGYNFFFNNELPQAGGRHALTITGYIPVCSGKKIGETFPMYE